MFVSTTSFNLQNFLRARKIFFIALLINAVFLLQKFEIVHYPIVNSLIFGIERGIWTISVFFHELGHGIFSLLTFGGFHGIAMNLMGGFAITSSDGLFMLYGGYLGSIIFGLLMYFSITVFFKHNINAVPKIFGILALIGFLFLSRSFSTFIILLIISLIFFGLEKNEKEKELVLILKFLAIYCIIDGAIAPVHTHYYWYLYDSEFFSKWDGKKLAQLTKIPELVFVWSWFVIGLIALIVIFIWEGIDFERDQINNQYFSRPLNS
jgi:hypothetical protein